MESFSTAKHKLDKLWNLAQYLSTILKNPEFLQEYIVQNDLIEPVFTLHDSGWQKFSTQNQAEALTDALASPFYQGAINASTNPNYPDADLNDLYNISVAGKIGGNNGIRVKVGNLIKCLADDTPSGDQITVGERWAITGFAVGGDNAIETVKITGTNLLTILKRYDLEYGFNLDIPDLYLPFVDFQLKIKTIDGTEILGLEPAVLPFFEKIETVKIAGTTVYTGVSRVPHFLYDESYVTDGTIGSIDYLKNVWSVNNNVNRRVKSITINYDPVTATSPCGANTNFKTLLITYHSSAKHNITSLTPTNVTGIGNITQHTFTFNGSICVDTVTTLVDKGSVNKNFTDADVTSVSIQTENQNGVASTTFTSITAATQIGYWLYYGSDKNPPRLGFKTVSLDSTLNAVAGPTYADIPLPDLGTIIATPTGHETVTYVSFDKFFGWKNFGVFKITNNEVLNTYKINLNSRVILKSKWKQTGQINFLLNQKINTFTFGTEYTESLSTPNSYLIDTIEFPIQDVQYKIIATFKNPFYYRNQIKINE